MGTSKRVIVVTSTGDYQRLKEPVGLTTPMLSDNGTKPVWIEAGGGGGPTDAVDVTYDPTAAGLVATDVQAAIDEVAGIAGGVPDHGALGGLGDDDHPLYTTEAEATAIADAEAAAVVATHEAAFDPHASYTTDAEATTIAVTEAGAAVSDHAAVPTAHHTNANDPSAGEKAALAGTSGTPGSGNKYVTDGDARNTDARTPSAHTHAHSATTGQTANDHHAQSHTQADHDAAEAADIAAVGTAASAGTSAEVPNADHVHAHEAAHINHDTTWAAKGDLIAATANDAAAVVPVGTAGQLLLPDSAASAGLAWFDALFPTMMLPTGAIAATAARSTPFGNINLLASGRITLCGIWLPKGRTITSISFVSATVPMAVGTNQWFALYDSSRALLRVTSDDTSTAWAANSVKTLNLSSTFDTTYAGLHYVAVMVAATTVPTLTCVTTSATLNALAPVLCGSCNTGLTNPASAPNPASNFPTGAGVVPYAFVS